MTQIARHGSNTSESMRSLPKRFSLSLLAFYFGSSLAFNGTVSAQQTTHPSQTITYQASINQNGPLEVTARLYSDPAGLQLVWEENISTSATNGVLNLELGASTPLPASEMDKGLYLGLSVNKSEELRPLTRLTATPVALTVPDGAISRSKISASYIESITINGRKIEGSGATLNIATGKGITAGYDEGSNTVLFAASSTGSKGAGTLSNEVIDGNLTVNGNTDLGGSATDPTITFTAKAASALDMDGNELQNVGGLSLAGAGSTITLDGSVGTAGQVLTSQGAGATPEWTSPASAWGLGGATGTTAGTDYLGTNDDQPFEIHVHHSGSASEGRQRVLRFEPTGQSANIILGHNQNAVISGVNGGTIGGGGDASYKNEVLQDFGTISGGRANTASQFATVSGGEWNSATNAYATVGGGYDNGATSTNSTVAGGYSNLSRANGAFIGGGEDNTARGNLSVIGGGYFNRTFAGASTIGGGESNTTDNTGATIGGGSNNISDGYMSTLGGGELNWASGLHSVISGGYNNSAYGHNSAIAGGRYLTLGAHSFGFNAESLEDRTDLSTMSNIAYFGNANVMIGNVDGEARAVRFYEGNGDHSYASTNYTSFKAPALGANVEYTLPSSQGAASSVLSNNGSGSLSWQVLTLAGDVSGPLGSNTVSSVGGQSAANVAAATISANAATALNTASTIVKRDASGNFAAGTITASLNGNVTGNITGNVSGNVLGDLTGNVLGNVTGNVTGDLLGNVTGNVTGNVSGNAGTVTNGVYTSGSYANPSWITSLDASKITGLTIDNTSFTGELEGDVTGTQTATVVSFVGGASAANVASTVTAVASATNANTASTIVSRDAQGDVALGTLIASDGVEISNGVLRLSAGSVTSANAGIAIPPGYGIVRIAAGATLNFNYTLPSGSEGQVLYIYNSANKRANNGVRNIDPSTTEQFIYVGGGWRVVG